MVAALLDGPRRFGELQQLLPGLAPNILTKRLRQLETDGLIVATAYSKRPPRFAYRLTEDGTALADVLRLLAQWGGDHPPAAGSRSPADDAAEPLHHSACGTPVQARWWCPTCASLVEDTDASELRWA